jgi:L,D-peptidoglycan transpeptidase YkuD (ErfK/YbiS/YcfS/YnhG family)
MHIPFSIIVTSNGLLHLQDITLRCALGKNGVTHTKQEGDGKTPLGTFPLRALYYRPDRMTLPPALAFTTIPITPSMGWCDDPAHPAYNLPVALPFAASHETLWREDHRYDIIIPLGYNDAPPVAGMGSAIFFHIAAEDYAGTEGCVAISLNDMERLLPQLTPTTIMIITE